MFQDWSARERRHGRNDVPQLCEDAADELAALRAERDQFKAMWERDSTALGKALAQRDTARVDAEDKRARVAELEGLLKRARPRVESFAFTTKYEEEARAARELAREIRAGLAGGSAGSREDA